MLDSLVENTAKGYIRKTSEDINDPRPSRSAEARAKAAERTAAYYEEHAARNLKNGDAKRAANLMQEAEHHRRRAAEWRASTHGKTIKGGGQ